MEIGLGVEPQAQTTTLPVSFNPCFVGNRSGSLVFLLPLFQSSLFQSLFCWKSVWEVAVSTHYIRKSDCFNPCFVGNRSGRRWKRCSPECCSLFQSLFCWKSVWELVVVDEGKKITPTFQSLFCWKSVWEWFRSYAATPRSWVSILVLLEIGLGVWKRVEANQWKLVSILVLLEIGLGDSAKRKLPTYHGRFNPCFVGNRSGRGYFWTGCKGGRSVSILVLLEIGLGVNLNKKQAYNLACFNPCFVGNRSGRKM